MKQIFLSFLLFGLFHSCFAEGYTISLAERLLSSKLQGYYLSDLILSQSEDSCLGYFHPFGPNRYVTVYFTRNIRAEIKALMERSMPQHDSLKLLIIRLNRIYLYETTKGVREYTNLDLSVSYIFPTDSGLCEDFTAAVTLSVIKLKHPAEIPSLITRSFDQCIQQYLERKRLKLLRPAILQANQLPLNPVNTTYCNHFGQVKKPARGIYRTWFDFRDSKPDSSFEFKVLHNYHPRHKQLSKAYLKFTGGDKPTEIWGFSDGDSVFINAGKAFTLLENSGDTLITYGRSSEYTQDVVTAAIFGSVLCGLVGGTLLGGVVAATTDPDVLEKFRIDTFNGKLLPYDSPDYTRISSGVVLYLSKVSDPDATLIVFADENPICEMKPGTYKNLNLSCHYQSVTIRLVSSTGGETTENIPLELYKTSVFLLKIKWNHTVTINQLHDQMRRDVLKNRTSLNILCD